MALYLLTCNFKRNRKWLWAKIVSRHTPIWFLMYLYGVLLFGIKLDENTKFQKNFIKHLKNLDFKRTIFRPIYIPMINLVSYLTGASIGGIFIVSFITFAFYITFQYFLSCTELVISICKSTTLIWKVRSWDTQNILEATAFVLFSHQIELWIRIRADLGIFFGPWYGKGNE